MDGVGLESYPSVFGKKRAGVPLSDLTWFRVGGEAEVFVTPQDEADLSSFLSRLDPGIPLWVLGVGSNVLVRDGGVSGVTVRLGRSFSHMTYDPETSIFEVGAFALDRHFARFALEKECAGFSFFEGIPGTIGGALRMNAGAHGGQTSDFFLEARALDRRGRTVILSREDMGFVYRGNGVPDDLIFTSARFRGVLGDRETIAQEMEVVVQTRGQTQPIKSRTGGSTFKNPPGHSAWKLIDQAGMRGKSIGGAHVSALHCNFLVNDGTATAKDIETLGNTVQDRVREVTGIALEWEIKKIGVAG